jgi:hypothetical protein
MYVVFSDSTIDAKKAITLSVDTDKHRTALTFMLSNDTIH